jgi:SAM-dependent MidA family methyltransferase
MWQPELLELIRSEIAGNGPISFARFMAHALYHPRYGYYTSGAVEIGPRGDYYTSSSVHSIFGEMIARQILQMRAALRPTDGRFQMVEMGAGHGTLARDILRTIRKSAGDEAVSYVIVEKSPRLIERQRECLAGFPVQWAEEIPSGVVGVILSNELVDAFPVHRLRMSRQQTEEMRVDWQEGRLCPVWISPVCDRLQQQIDRLDLAFETRTEFEINLCGLDWMREVASALRRGFVLTIDYGYPAETLYSAKRPRGTFLCYHQQTVNEAPFERVGEQDMTAHVDFTSLARVGCEAGLALLGFTDQTHFLMGLGIAQRMEEEAASTSGVAGPNFLAMKQLMAPGGMGSVFKVLVQAKEVPSDVALDGLRFRSHAPLL